MEVLKEILATIAVLAIGVPLVLILIGAAASVTRIFWTFADEMQNYIACKIKKRIRDEYKSPENGW